MFVHSPPSRCRGKNKIYATTRGGRKIIMLYNTKESARDALRLFVPEQTTESLFKKGDVVTVTADEFDLVNTDEKGENNALSAKIIIKRDGKEIERTITLRTLFGTIRTDIPKDLEEGVDTILPYAKAHYESRFKCPYNVADALKNLRLPDKWTFEVVEIPALVNQYVDRNNKDIQIHDDLKKKTLNGQKYLNGLYRLRTVTCSKR